MQTTPIKINQYPGESIAMEIRRFVGYMENIIQRKPNYGNTFFKTDEGKALMLSVDLNQEEVEALRSREEDFEFEIVDRPWTEVYNEYKLNKTRKKRRKKK